MQGIRFAAGRHLLLEDKELTWELKSLQGVAQFLSKW
jgi:hypothetical protein